MNDEEVKWRGGEHWRGEHREREGETVKLTEVAFKEVSELGRKKRKKKGKSI